MSLPTVTQTWTYSTNNRYSFSTVQGAMQAFMFSLKNFLVTTMSYTVKGSCNGTTGAMDGVDRWTTAANITPRFSGAAGAQAWFVVTDAQGIDWCFSYNAASDDVFRLGHSQGGVYIVAATSTQQPTATDECFDATNLPTWVNSTASADRVWHLWGSADKKMWRAAVYRSSAVVLYLAGEKFSSTIVSPATFTLQTGGGTKAAIKSYYNGTSAGLSFNSTYSTGAGQTVSDVCKVHTNSDVMLQATIGAEMPGGGVGNAGLSFFSGYAAETPALQGGTGELLWPASLGSRTSTADGQLGTKFDHWCTITNSSTVPAVVDTYGTLQFISILAGGAIILSWDGVSSPLSA